MAVVTADIVSRIAELSDGAFQAFSDDIAGMFDVDVRCKRQGARPGPAGDLRGRFEKLVAVHQVRAEGALDGTFHLLFDQGGLFVLSGIIVMLQDSRIIENVEGGSLDEAMNLLDAEREVGNLLVGSWDRVFREDCEGHGHFVKTGTSLWRFWDDPEALTLPADKEVVSVVYEMTVGSYPHFRCGVVFPRAMLANFRGIDGGSDEATPADPTATDPSPEQEPSVVSPSAQGEDGPQPAETKRSEAAGAAAATPSESEAEATDTAGREEPVPSELEASYARDLSHDTVDTAALPSEIAARSGSGSIPLHVPGPSFIDPRHVHSAPPARQATAEMLNLSAAAVMRRDVVWADPEDTVADVVAKMQQHNVGYVLVGPKGQLEGLVSNSNVLGAVSLYLRPMFAKWRRPEDDATLRVKVKWIMSRPVRTVRPDATVAAMIENLCRYGGRCLPVVDARGAVQGMVTMHDILLRVLEVDGKFAWKGSPPQAPVLLS